MSSSMKACERCGRHLRATEKRCPFCASTRVPAAVRKAAAVAATVAVGVGLSACYGGPPRRDNLERYDKDAYPPSPPATTAPKPPASDDSDQKR